MSLILQRRVALLAKIAEAEHEVAENERRIEAMRLWIALDGDMEASDRFANRMLDLERRFDAWEDADFENWRKASRWRAEVRWSREFRP